MASSLLSLLANWSASTLRRLNLPFFIGSIVLLCLSLSSRAGT
jgi:hypothetical protein